VDEKPELFVGTDGVEENGFAFSFCSPVLPFPNDKDGTEAFCPNEAVVFGA
jgi:hypothetical protein